MDKKVLILGGTGSVGMAIAKKLSSKYQIALIDIKKPRTETNFKIIIADALDSKALSEQLKSQRPDIIINNINLATIFSHDPLDGYPKITRFYVDLYKALQGFNKPVHYIQIGTTGTGGLGFNVPFSHGEKLEDLPLIHKGAFAGITTALLTLLSRSFPKNQVVISELKPGLAIFNQQITAESFRGIPLVLIDGGENGRYTYNELAILTSMMGFTTADRIAERVVAIVSQKTKSQSIRQGDVIDSLNQTILHEEKQDNEDKKKILARLKTQSGPDAVITSGSLGPPSLVRDLILGYVMTKSNQPNGQNDFGKKFQENNVAQATLEYIKSRDQQLFEYLEEACTYDNYVALKKYFMGQQEPWEILARKFSSENS